MKRVLNVRNVRGSPILAHIFEMRVRSRSVLQCSNCSSAYFQCLGGWFTQIMSNKEFLSTTVPRSTAYRFACGTCPFEARLFILGLTSVVCHILSCFHGNTHDCSWYTRDSTTKWCHTEAPDAKIHTIRADNPSQTKRNIIALRKGG